LVIAPCTSADSNSDILAFSNSKGFIFENSKLKLLLKSIHSSLYGYIHANKFDTLFQTGNLSQWARQGMLLVNNSLTREAKTLHTKMWEPFMNDLYKSIADNRKVLGVILYDNSLFHLEKHFTGKYHKVFKVESSQIEQSTAFADAYVWIDNATEKLFLETGEVQNIFSKINLNLDKYIDMELFMKALKTMIIENNFPYANAPTEIKNWNEGIKQYLTLEFRRFFDLSLKLK